MYHLIINAINIARMLESSKGRDNKVEKYYESLQLSNHKTAQFVTALRRIVISWVHIW